MSQLFRIGPAIGYRAQNPFLNRLTHVMLGGLFAFFSVMLYFAGSVGTGLTFMCLGAFVLGGLLAPVARQYTIYAQRRWIGYATFVMFLALFGVYAWLALQVRGSSEWPLVFEMWGPGIFVCILMVLEFVEFRSEENLLPPVYLST